MTQCDCGTYILACGEIVECKNCGKTWLIGNDETEDWGLMAPTEKQQ